MQPRFGRFLLRYFNPTNYAQCHSMEMSHRPSKTDVSMSIRMSSACLAATIIDLFAEFDMFGNLIGLDLSPIGCVQLGHFSAFEQRAKSEPVGILLVNISGPGGNY
ncbi:unnamed protein product [Mesocestoides corti]|uniref:Uncharacterized protein n=1 Tax=Mesocestoides corti TaxID=53468 RepID=A0A0R3U7E1_MESCO|nr:unnamed protein product [Mesocestoides corti]